MSSPGDKRVGDATLQRIDDLASGWTSAPPARVGRSSGPPRPPPGRKKPPPADLDAPRIEPDPSDGIPTDVALAPVSGMIEAVTVREGEEQTVLHPPGSGAFPIAPGEAPRKVSNSTGTLRMPQTLPRRRGVLGDMVYAYTATFGVAGARRELTRVDRNLTAEKASRERRLADLARLALADLSVESATMQDGREEFVDLEDQRSRRAGAVASADAEVAVLERDRAAERDRRREEIETLRRQARETDEKLAPLERRAQAARRKAARLRENLADLERRIGREETRLLAVDGKDQAAEKEAHIASLRAERETIVREEPAIAGELDDLEPLIASLVASRADALSRAVRLEREESDAVVRTAEMVTAAKARRAVEERAEAEIVHAQEEALRGLGERLSVERPAELAARLRGIEEHEVAVAMLERRHLELSELVKGVDRWAMVRGIAWVSLVAAVVAALAIWIVAQQL